MGVNQVLATALFACLTLSFIDAAASKCGTCGEECQEAARKIKSTLDETVDPCDDFYKFACGRFDKTVEDIPDGKDSYTSDGTPITELMYKLGKAMMEEQLVDTSFETDEKLRNTYDACTNLKEQDELGLKPMEEVVMKLGGWPVAEGPNFQPSKTWQEVMLEGNRLGLEPDYFMRLSVVGTDSGNTFWLNPEKVFLGEKTPAKKVESYKKYMEAAAVLFGASPAYAKQEMGKVYDLQLELAKLDENTDFKRGEYPLSDLENLFSPTGLSVKQFLQTLVGGDSDDKVLQGTQKVQVVGFEFFGNVAEIFKRTKDTTMLNYIIWRAVLSKMTSLGEKARALANEYQKANEVNLEPKWRECLPVVGIFSYDSPLSGAIGSLFYRKHFEQNNAESVQAMYTTMKKSYLDIVRSTKWMSDDKRQIALDKIKAGKMLVHIPPQLDDKTKVDKVFADLSGISPTEHVKNLLALSKFSFKQRYGLIKDNVGKDHWTRQMVQALPSLVYNRPYNVIYILAGSLVGSIYDSKLPEYMNYGAYGFDVAQYFNYAFDEPGLGGEWQTDPAFKGNLDCFVDQYKKAEIPGLPGYTLNAEAYKFSIFNVNSALRLAYKAYGDYVANMLKGKQETKLPGLEKYSPQKMFWISFGQASCSVYKQEALKNAAAGLSWLPNTMRSMHLRNREEFSRDFGCHANAPMNPKIKCQMWGSCV